MRILSVSIDKEEHRILVKLHDKSGSEFQIKLTEDAAENFIEIVLRKLTELRTPK